MTPIKAPSIINRGIALYVPAINEKRIVINKIDIYYSNTHPNYNWVTCDNSQSLVWTKEQPQTESGDLYLYTVNNLVKGFYKIVVSKYLPTRGVLTGQLVIGLLQPTDKIIIGLPYSVYPPITLS